MNTSRGDWVLTKLGDVVAPSKAKADPKQFPNQPYVGLEHVEAHTMRLLGHGRGADVESTKSTFRKGDVLYGKLRPYLNKVAQPDFDGLCSTDFLVFRESTQLDPDYLAQYLNQAWVADAATQASRGVQLPRVNWQFLANLPVSFPPDKSEQRAIAGLLRSIRDRQSGVRDHLAGAKRAVDRFRQSVLSAACSGRLTHDWRAANLQASALALSEDLRKSASLVTETYREAKVVEESMTDLDPGDLPGSWAIAPLHLLIERGRPITYGILKPGPDVPSGIPYLRVTDFKSGAVLPGNIRRTTPAIAQQYRRSILREGDLLFAIRGTFGQVATVPADLAGANITQDTARLSVDSRLSAEFVSLVLKAPHVQRRIAEAAKGVAVRGINLGDLRELLLPLPPRAEQDEIVRRVARLLAHAESIVGRIDSVYRAIDISARSILSTAVGGDT